MGADNIIANNVLSIADIWGAGNIPPLTFRSAATDRQRKT